MSTRVAVQMGINGYGIMGDLPERDLATSLDQVRAAGATGVEVMTNLLADTRSLRAACDAAELEITGLHVFWPQLDEDLLRKVREIGAPRLICSGAPVATTDECLDTAGSMLTWAAAARRVDSEFLLHNHEEECRPLTDGRTPLEIIAERTAAEGVGFVVDVYWATRAGADLASVFTTVAGRCDYVHFKDGLRAERDEVPRSYGLGEGQVDLDLAWSSAVADGNLSWAVVERDTPASDSKAAVRHDVEVLRSFIGAGARDRTLR